MSGSGSALASAPCSAPVPGEDWALGVLDKLRTAIQRSGDTVTLSHEDAAYTLSLLIQGMGAWCDAARLNWLDARGALWTVKMEGEEMGTGRIRDAINLAILRAEAREPNVASETRGKAASNAESGTEPRCL